MTPGDPSCKKVDPPSTFSETGIPATSGDQDAQYRELEQTTAGLKFGKAFHTALEAAMTDKTLTNGERVMTWVMRRSFASYSLYCVNPDRTPAYAADCARELNLNPGTVSHILDFKKRRGYIDRVGTAKVIYPVIAPVLSPVPEKVECDATYAEFLEGWKVANASTWQELENAESTAKRIRKIVLAAWHALQRPQRTGDASLYKIPEDFDLDLEASSSAAASFEDATTTPIDPPAEAGTPPEPSASLPSLEAEVVLVFVEAGKDTPTPTQLAAAVEALDPHPDAGRLFLDNLRGKIARVRHPGALLGLVRDFNVGLPVLLQMELRRRRPEPERSPPGMAEAIAARCGEGSVESFRLVTGNPEADADDLFREMDAIRAEFALPARREAGSERNEEEEAKEQG